MYDTISFIQQQQALTAFKGEINKAVQAFTVATQNGENATDFEKALNAFSGDVKKLTQQWSSGSFNDPAQRFMMSRVDETPEKLQPKPNASAAERAAHEFMSK
ncbi:MAG TPA: hypothetical protein VGG19_20645 [Tepidisphaeraceae bacterium]